MEMDNTELVVYTRDGCHLCDALLDELTQFCSKKPYTFTIIEISGDALLEQRYGTKVPVVTYQGAILCYYFLDTDIIDVYFDTSRN